MDQLSYCLVIGLPSCLCTTCLVCTAVSCRYLHTRMRLAVVEARRAAAGLEPDDHTHTPIKYETLKKNMMKHFIKAWSAITLGGEDAISKAKELIKVKEKGCPICFEKYDLNKSDEKSGNEEDPMVGVVISCGHTFHFECLWAWLERKRTCPLCRHDVKLSEDDIMGIPLSIAAAQLRKTGSYSVLPDDGCSLHQGTDVDNLSRVESSSDMPGVHKVFVITSETQINRLSNPAQEAGVNPASNTSQTDSVPSETEDDEGMDVIKL